MRRVLHIFTLVLFSAFLAGCEEPEAEETVFEAENDRFSLMELNTLNYTLADETRTFSHLSGLDIASGDYDYAEGTLRIHPHFLWTLPPGEHTLDARMDSGSVPISFTVADENNAHRIVNGGFETGDLSGWTAETAFKGEMNLLAFQSDAIRANAAFGDGDIPYEGDGEHVFGHDPDDPVWVERLGRMRSTPFILGGSGHITFRLGGAMNCDLAYMSIRKTGSDEEVARYCNEDPSEEDDAQLVRYRADLSDHMGEALFIEFTDIGTSSRDYLVIDAIETYHQETPGEGIRAQDMKPEFDQPFAPNQLQNGDFSDGLDHWTISEAPGWEVPDAPETFHVESGMLKSNAGGNASRGLIRSSLFRIDGSGVMSLELAAAQGAMFDKDTFVSVRQSETNRELYRFANVHSDGTVPVEYFIDLSDHLGETVYLEIVDNAQGDYDTIFIGDIRTHYATRPDFTYSDTAPDLNE